MELALAEPSEMAVIPETRGSLREREKFSPYRRKYPIKDSGVEAFGMNMGSQPRFSKRNFRPYR